MFLAFTPPLAVTSLSAMQGQKDGQCSDQGRPTPLNPPDNKDDLIARECHDSGRHPFARKNRVGFVTPASRSCGQREEVV